MKNLMKLIVITAMAALLICVAMSFALADERIYTSPVFKLPADKVIDWAENQPEEEKPEETEPGEKEPGEEVPGEDEPGETEPGSTEETAEPEPEKKERRVRIYSSQGAVVTEGEIIYLTSKIEGFDDVEVTYQWQVNRGDGAGWVNVEGANRPKHSYVASKETVKYSWRLVVNVEE